MAESSQSRNEDDSPVQRYRSIGELMRATASSDQRLEGTGLPYAPENWPNPGDIWSWRTGKRISTSGYFKDRYLYPPQRLHAIPRSRSLDCRSEIKKFVTSVCPYTDVNAFFASFTWKIPSHYIGGPQLTVAAIDAPPEDAVMDAADAPPEGDVVDVPPEGAFFSAEIAVILPAVSCKIGNASCVSLVSHEPGAPDLLPCADCCAEPWFCRHCTCHICLKRVSSDHEGHDYVRCEALVDGMICGHVADYKCAFSKYMAGKVRGTEGGIDLDAEYYCERCDSKTDLIPYAERVVRLSEAMSAADQHEVCSVLKPAMSVLRGSERPRAQEILSRIESAFHFGE